MCVYLHILYMELLGSAVWVHVAVVGMVTDNVHWSNNHGCMECILYILAGTVKVRGTQVSWSHSVQAGNTVQSPVESFTKKVNSLWPNDAIWWHRSGSTLAQVMACCLTASSHYLKQCWLIISEVQRHSPGRNFMRDVLIINRKHELENHLNKTLLKSPRGQWVNFLSKRGYWSITQAIFPIFKLDSP